MEMPGKIEMVREMNIKEDGDRNIKECTASLNDADRIFYMNL
jgi:hypothetical protein